jgi:hypothetical protein
MVFDLTLPGFPENCYFFYKILERLTEEEE